MSEETSQRPLRILFVNRMAAMERGGGETFDLEIARELAELGCRVRFLTGVPLLGRARLRPETWWPGRRACNSTPDPTPAEGGRMASCRALLPDAKGQIEGQGCYSPSAIGNVVTLRSPYFGWFPWDKVKGGWRLRVADFTIFEWRAARWIARHASAFDIVQLCELPNVVVFASDYARRKTPETPLPRFVIRLTAPNYYDPRGGIPRADGLIASGTTVQKLHARGETRVVNVPNAVDTDRFCPHPSPFRRAYGIPDDALVLVYVARFQDFKNHAMLVRAFAEASNQEPRLRLVLAGSGPLAPRIRDQIAAHGIAERVWMLGEVGFDALPDVYAAADINVISSDYESFCFAAIEGMATGLPLVTTDCGWAPGLIGDTLPPIEKQWVNGDTDPPTGRFEDERPGARIRTVPGGLVTGRNDASSFAAALLRLARDAGARRAMGAWNREKAVREHGWRASAARLLAYYRELLAR